MASEILIRAADGSSRTLALEGERYAVGRSRGSEIAFPDDPSLSRSHFVLERDGDGWAVHDLGSKNGTQVDGERIVERCRLHPGSRIEAGQIVFIFEPGSEPRPDPVHFYAAPDTEIPKGTVMTDLRGLLSGERTVPTPGGSAPAVAAKPGGLFANPAVRALMKAGKELSGHRPLPDLFRLILDLSIEAVGAERAILMTLEGDRLVTQASHGEGFRISNTVRDRVLESGTSLLVTDVLQDEAWAARQSISEQQVRTMMAVPLQTETRVIGMMYLDSRYFVREFTPDDLSLLTVLANVAATRIEQERLRILEELQRSTQRDMSQAADIQQRFLPRGAPSIPGLEVAGHNAPCRTVGGDYYDFISCPDGRIGVVLGDVAGKGMPAALMMTGLQATLHALAAEVCDLPHLVSRLDRFVADRAPDNRFVSLFFGVLEAATGDLNYCNAGHNPPYLVRVDGSVERLPGGGTMLGILPDVAYEEQHCRLDPGDVVMLYSDGVTEMTNPQDEEFGEERLAEVLRTRRRESPQAIIDAVNNAVVEFAAGVPPADDLTLVVVRRR